MEYKQKLSRNRSTNFTIDEKTCLFTLVSKYKHILENKKTDAVSNNEKNNTWEKVAREFNAILPGNVQRPTDVLKRFYDNNKKALRKRCANLKLHVRGTGGGPPLPDNDRHPTDELLLSIVNEKTVHGLNPPFGGDVESDSEVQCEVDEIFTNNVAEVVYEVPSMTDEAINGMGLELVNIPELRSTQPSTITATSQENGMGLELVNIRELKSTQPSTSTATSQENISKTWASYGPSDLLGKVSSPLKRKISRISSHTKEENEPGPSTYEKTPKSSSRRRPAVVVKSLTSSDVAAKYDKLLDCRLEIVASTKKELDQRTQQSLVKHEKEMLLLDAQLQTERGKMVLLETQLEIEREKLKLIKKA